MFDGFVIDCCSMLVPFWAPSSLFLEVVFWMKFRG